MLLIHAIKRLMLYGLVIFGTLHLPLPMLGGVDRDGYQRDPSLAALLFPYVITSYRSTVIRSMQRAVITVTAGNASNTATVTAVASTANAVVEAAGWSGDSAKGSASNLTFGPFRCVLTNTTTITCTQGVVVGTDTISIPVQLTEYYPWALTANGVQRGTIALASAASNTASITAVSAKAELRWGGWSNEQTDAYALVNQAGWWPRQVLTSTTVVTVSCPGTCSVTMPYQVVDYR